MVADIPNTSIAEEREKKYVCNKKQFHSFCFGHSVYWIRIGAASIQSDIRVDCWSNTYATIYLIPGKLQEQRMMAFFVISFVSRPRIAGSPDTTFSLVEDFVNARNPQHVLCDRNQRPVEFIFTIGN